MSIKIDGKRLIPAPLVQFAKSYNFTGDGRRISPNYTITLNGSLMPNHGSPFSDRTWYSGTSYPTNEAFTTDATKFNSILSKQEAIRELFHNPGVLFQYGPIDNSSPVSGFVKINSIDFTPGTWVDRCDYSIVFETEFINKTGSPSGEDSLGSFADLYLTQAGEDFNIVQDDNGETFTVTHNISAVGRAAYSMSGVLRNSNVEPWQNAKTWVISRNNDDISSSLINTVGKAKFNRKSVENVDIIGGAYSLNNTYVHSSGNQEYSHIYDINRQTTRSQINDLNNGQLLTDNITINGTILGLYPSGFSASGRLSVARAFFNTIEPQIPTLVGFGTGFLFVNKTVSENQTNGSVNYSINYTNYPNNNTYTHTYSIIDNHNSNGISTATINGAVQGLTSSGNILNAFGVATGIWAASIRPSLDTIIEGIIGSGLAAHPVNLAVGYDRSEARVTYNATYNYVEENNPTTANYLDTWEITLNDGRSNTASTISKTATVTINGNIVGYALNGSSNDRYNNAATQWNSVKATLKDRFAPIIAPALVANKILSRTETHNKVNGVITYAQTNSLRTDITETGIISEDIVVDTQYPKDVFAVQIIPGLSTGPIIQNIGTRTETRTTLSVNFLLEPTGTYTIADTRYTTLENTFAPTGTKYVENYNTNYDPIAGKYSKTKTWVYKT